MRISVTVIEIRALLRAVVLCAVALTLTPQVMAQTLARAAEQPTSGSTTPAGNAQSNGLLTQADVTGSPSTTQVGLQAADLFITGTQRTGYAKVYFRTTVPLTQSDSGTTDKTSSSPATASTTKSTLPATAVNALLDPYGGIMNLAVGYWRQMAPGYSRDQNGNKDGRLDNEGLFVDARAAIKMVNLPSQASTSPTLAGTSVTPFVTGSFALRYAHTLYDGKLDKALGLLEASLAILTNVAADKSVSAAFDDTNRLVANRTSALSGSVALQLNGNLAITITASPWSSNGSAPDLGKNYQIGIKLLSASK